jgi:hypothetical protein
MPYWLAPAGWHLERMHAQLASCLRAWARLTWLPCCPLAQVYGLEWCPYEQSHGTISQFVTFGKKHMKLWSQQAGGVYAPTQLSFGKLPLQNVSSGRLLLAGWLAGSG